MVIHSLEREHAGCKVEFALQVVDPPLGPEVATERPAPCASAQKEGAVARLVWPSCALCDLPLYGPGQAASDGLHHTPGVFCVPQCPRCGHHQPPGALTREALAEAYPPHYLAHALSRADCHSWRQKLVGHFVRQMERRRAAWVRRHVPLSAASAVLDAGCGNGGFLNELQAQTRCRCIGIEMSTTAVREARTNSALVIHCGKVGDALPGDERVDLLTLWHVLEHLPRPVETLRALRATARQGGHLIVAVPDAKGLAARTFGNYWFGRDVPRHVSHFTPESLCAALACGGWRPLHLEHVTEISTVAGSVHNLLRRRWCDDVPGHLLRWLTLQGCCLPLDHLLRLLGQGDWLVAVARRA